ncbi:MULTISPECIES: hypothetical protein [unclassified Streptomyces]|uniref:hypothetical protein n=1 Tax=unclassified Streptomyces TaxID=2593676 RepID=UPI003817FD4B
MDASNSLAPLELAVHRLRDAQSAADAARADMEMEAVLAVRRGGALQEVAAAAGLDPAELTRLEAVAGELPPR